MIKNVIVVYDYAFINGGAAKVAIQSAIALSKTDLNVHYYSAVGPVCDELCNSNVEVHCLNMDDINTGSRMKAVARGIWNTGAKKNFAAFLSSFDKADTIVHVHGWCRALSSSIFSVTKKMGFKTVVTLHDYFTLCPNGGFYDFKKGCICKRKPMSLHCMTCNCDKRSFLQKLWRVARQVVQDHYVRKNKELAFISISQLNEDVIRPYVTSEKFYRVTNMVELSEVKNADVTATRNFLYIGRVAEEKGIELFCQAIDALRGKYQDIQGIIAGTGNLESQLKEQYPFMKFEGWKTHDELETYMMQARALIFPSKWYEAAPLTTLEALSCNLPCIVSDCTSCAGEQILDGENGFVFKAGNAESLVEKLELMLEDGKAAEIQNNIKLNFDRSIYMETAHVRRLLAVYKEVISE